MPGRSHNQSMFTEYKPLVRWVSDKAYEKYLGDILGLNTDNLDHDLGEIPKVKTKKNVTLSRLVRRANRVDFACDTYKYPSINDVTEKTIVW